MLLKDAYLDRVAGEVEEVAARMALLKGRFAKQKVNVKLEYYWELEHVRARLADFKHRVGALEDAEPDQLDRFQTEVEESWTELMGAVDTLMEALS